MRLNFGRLLFTSAPEMGAARTGRTKEYGRNNKGWGQVSVATSDGLSLVLLMFVLALGSAKTACEKPPCVLQSSN